MTTKRRTGHSGRKRRRDGDGRGSHLRANELEVCFTSRFTLPLTVPTDELGRRVCPRVKIVKQMMEAGEGAATSATAKANTVAARVDSRINLACYSIAGVQSTRKSQSAS